MCRVLDEGGFAKTVGIPVDLSSFLQTLDPQKIGADREKNPSAQVEYYMIPHNIVGDLQHAINSTEFNTGNICNHYGIILGSTETIDRSDISTDLGVCQRLFKPLPLDLRRFSKI